MEIADMGFEPMYLPYEGSEEPLLRNPRYRAVTTESNCIIPAYASRDNQPPVSLIDYCELAVYQGDTFL